MEYIYASLLLHAAGRQITEESLKRVLEAAGVAVDEVRVKMLVAALKEVNIGEVIKQAMVAAPAVQALPAAPTAAATPAPAPEKKEERKEEKKEVSEEEIAEGISALFG
ncbi:MAG: 50S ribosomal protein P1 [Desulfurococcaceae archaeon]|nr:50S ribosomal protein P1 [Desulfurococcaceae archaeon]